MWLRECEWTLCYEQDQYQELVHFSLDWWLARLTATWVVVHQVGSKIWISSSLDQGRRQL